MFCEVVDMYRFSEGPDTLGTVSFKKSSEKEVMKPLSRGDAALGT